MSRKPSIARFTPKRLLQSDTIATAAALAAAGRASYVAAMSWSLTLREPVRLVGGRWLRTCRDAAEIILSLPEGRQKVPYWLHTAELLLAAVERRGSRADLHDQLLRALAAERLLDQPKRTRTKRDLEAPNVGT